MIKLNYKKEVIHISKQSNKIPLDKYYTPLELAKYVVEKTKESLEKHKKIIHRMEEGENIRLGIRDSWDWFSYHPCEYVKTLDIKKCIVQVYEPGIDKFHKGHVSRFLI